ncbi:hypothetical protein BTVI_84787 [Pitangus sulphuratus]|nr:hypothetical protein BTVI_84787 [Pitangus sulphuratus]
MKGNKASTGLPTAKGVEGEKSRPDNEWVREPGDNGHGKRQCRNNISSPKDEDGHLTNRDRDKVAVFNAFLASGFNTDDRPRGSWCPELEEHDCKDDQLNLYRIRCSSSIPTYVWDLMGFIKNPQRADIIAKPLNDF